MPSALIKITQGLTTDSPGRAVVGAIDGTTHVLFSNGDNTGVVSWKYELLYVPPGSALVPTTQGPGVTSTFDMGIPDVPGCYRVRLTVADVAGVQDVDIRNFAIPFDTISLIAPPYQANPLPLPLTGVGAKYDEMNFGGQGFGWGGDSTTTRRLLYQALRTVDQMGYGGLSTYQTTGGTIATAGTIALASSADYEVQGTFLAKGETDHACMRRRAVFNVSSGGVVTQVGSTQTPEADIASGGAGAWAATIDTSSNTVRFRVTGAASTTIDWTVHYVLRRTNRV